MLTLITILLAEIESQLIHSYFVEIHKGIIAIMIIELICEISFAMYCIISKKIHNQEVTFSSSETKKPVAVKPIDIDKSAIERKIKMYESRWDTLFSEIIDLQNKKELEERYSKKSEYYELIEKKSSEMDSLERILKKLYEQV